MRMLRTFFDLILTLTVSWTFSHAAQAALQETWVTPEAPLSHEIESWKKITLGAENRSYLVQLGDPTSFELSQVLNFNLSDRLRLSTTRIPGEDVREMYTKLAARGAEFISLEGKLPTDDEIDRLKKIGFLSSVFALVTAPSAYQANLLHKLPGKRSLTLLLKHYPRYSERDQYVAVPLDIPLLFIMDFWPDYTQMDALNLIPHVKRLRVRGLHPDAKTIPYVNAIKNLEEISFEFLSLPELDAWKKIVRAFPGKNLQWITHQAPTKEHIAIFLQSAQGESKRRITIDSDLPLPADIQAELVTLGIPVEWIHATPFPSTVKAFTRAWSP